MADQSAEPVREIWRPDRRLTVETDQQLARAATSVIRLSQQVHDEELREIASTCLGLSEMAVKGSTLEEARKAGDGLALLVLDTHIAKGAQLRTR